MALRCCEVGCASLLAGCWGQPPLGLRAFPFLPLLLCGEGACPEAEALAIRIRNLAAAM